MILDDETDACSSLNGDDQDKVSALNILTSIPSLSNQKNTGEAFSGKHCYSSKRSRITSRTDPRHLLKGTRKRRMLLLWDHSLTVRRYVHKSHYEKPVSTFDKAFFQHLGEWLFKCSVETMNQLDLLDMHGLRYVPLIAICFSTKETVLIRMMKSQWIKFVPLCVWLIRAFYKR